jgi:hypothetical protein
MATVVQALRESLIKTSRGKLFTISRIRQLNSFGGDSIFWGFNVDAVMDKGINSKMIVN